MFEYLELLKYGVVQTARIKLVTLSRPQIQPQ